MRLNGATKMFNASALTASITVADIRKSMAWYRDVVGFEVQQEHERDGVLRAVSLQAGEVRILLNQEDGARGWDRVKGEGASRFNSSPATASMRSQRE